MKVYGTVWLKGKNESIDLDGAVTQFNPYFITSIGKHCLGNEAHILIKPDKGKDQIIKTLKEARSFFRNFFKSFDIDFSQMQSYCNKYNVPFDSLKKEFCFAKATSKLVYMDNKIYFTESDGLKIEIEVNKTRVTWIGIESMNM